MLKHTEENSHCPLRMARDKLTATGLRATRPRLALAWLLFGKGERHVTADELFNEAQRAKVNVSHATVYNVLNSFAEAGLVRRFAVTGTAPSLIPNWAITSISIVRIRRNCRYPCRAGRGGASATGAAGLCHCLGGCRYPVEATPPITKETDQRCQQTEHRVTGRETMTYQARRRYSRLRKCMSRRGRMARISCHHRLNR